MTYASTNKCATTRRKKYTPNDQPWSWGCPPDEPEPEAMMATGSQRRARMLGHQAQSTRMSGTSQTCNPVDSPQVQGHVHHAGLGATLTPRSSLHAQSSESHLTCDRAKHHDSHLATCNDAFMHVKMTMCPLCNPPKLHEGLSGSNSKVHELTTAPILCSNEVRYNTTSSSLSLCSLPQSPRYRFYTGDDNQEAHKAPGLLSTLNTPSITCHVGLPVCKPHTPSVPSDLSQSLRHSYNLPQELEAHKASRTPFIRHNNENHIHVGVYVTL
jgi:hypothetical protein